MITSAPLFIIMCSTCSEIFLVRKMLPMLSPLTKLRLWEVDRKVCGARGGEESSANLQMSFIGFSKLMGIGWDAQLLEKHSRLVVASDFIAANQICKVPSWCLSAAGEKRRCSTWDAVAKQPPAIKNIFLDSCSLWEIRFNSSEAQTRADSDLTDTSIHLSSFTSVLAVASPIILT